MQSLEKSLAQIAGIVGQVSAEASAQQIADAVRGFTGPLPSWWTVDSTPGAESVEFGGMVSITPGAVLYGLVVWESLEFQPTNNAWISAQSLSGNHADVNPDGFYAQRALGNGNPSVALAGDDGFASFGWLGVATDAFVSSPTQLGFFDRAGVVDPTPQAAYPTTLGDVITLLRAYGLVAAP